MWNRSFVCQPRCPQDFSLCSLSYLPVSAPISLLERRITDAAAPSSVSPLRLQTQVFMFAWQASILPTEPPHQPMVDPFMTQEQFPLLSVLLAQSRHHCHSAFKNDRFVWVRVESYLPKGTEKTLNFSGIHCPQLRKRDVTNSSCHRDVGGLLGVLLIQTNAQAGDSACWRCPVHCATSTSG